MASATSADPTLEAGLYAYSEWHPIGQAVSGLSGPVQFRVRLPYSTMPAPWAVFAVHTTDPDNPWRVEGAPVTESFSPHEWIYYSPQFDTVPTRDGNWDAWCQVIYAEPPGGGEPDGAIGPGDGELAAVGAASLASWNPPPYGWPDGFPCPDNGQNDLYCGPTGFVAKNLTIDTVDLTGLTLVRMFCGGPAMPAPLNWRASLADGVELADNPSGVAVHFHLTPLAASTGQQDDTSVGSAPGSIGGAVPGGGTGLYYVDATAEEYLTGDNARWLSPVLSVTEVEPYVVAVTGPRTGNVYSLITTADAGGSGPLLGSQYVALRPGDFVLLGLLGDTPQASDGQTAEMAGPVDFKYAGDYAIAATYQDDAPGMHAGQHQWAVPACGTVHVPAGAFFADDAEDIADGCLQVASFVDGIVAEVPGGTRTDDEEFLPGFYSPRYPEGERGGLVVGGTVANWLAAVVEDDVMYSGGHGSLGHAEIRRKKGVEDVTASDIMRLPEGALSQMRFFHAGHCYSFHSSESTCICGAAVARGAQAAFGYLSASTDNAVPFEQLLWQYLLEGYSVRESVERAIEVLAAGGNWTPQSAGLADDPSTPYVEGYSIHGGDRYIVPAFAS